MPRLIHFILLVLLAAITVPATTALACSCAPPGSPEKSLAAAAMVVEARAISGPKAIAVADGTEDAPVMLQGPVEYQFEVIRSWKGSFGESLTVQTAADSAVCGRSYSLGTSYVLYLHNVNGDRASDGACSRTRSVKDAAEDLAFLGADQGSDEGKPSSAPTAPAENSAAPTSDTQGVTETTNPNPSSPKADNAVSEGKRGETEDSEGNPQSLADDAAPTCAVSGHEDPSSLLFFLVLGVSLTIYRRN